MISQENNLFREYKNNPKLNALFNLNVSDTQVGLKAFRRKVLEHSFPRLVVKQFAFDLELCFLAQEHGFRVVEAPIYVDHKDAFKESTINLGAIRGMFLDVLAIRYRFTILKYYQQTNYFKMLLC